MTILTVSQLNTYIKSVIDYDQRLKNIYLSGEISNLKIHYSGHIYFTLKDEISELRAVMFKGSAVRLRFEPENGMKVLVRGNVTVYESKGQYQIVCDDMQPDGIGALTKAFEQLKKKLESEGLFDEALKKPIPTMPEKIGVITASTGAAVHDIFSILERRYPIASILFIPVAVQGVNAAGEISSAIDRLSSSDCDVIIVGRGGGSTEDLWAFNEEIVARSIFNCRIPVISAVGHETDYTIADFVADLRAATPSAAAELCSTDWRDIAYTIDSISDNTEYLIKRIITRSDSDLRDSENKIKLYSPENKINSQILTLLNSSESINKSIDTLVERFNNQLQLLITSIDSHNPTKILSRGYAAVKDSEGNTVKSVKQLSVWQSVSIQLSDGKAFCTVNDLED